MVRRKDIAGSWAYFLSLFDIFIYNINSAILMANLVSAVKSLLIKPFFWYQIWIYYWFKYYIYPLSGASNIIIIISRSWNERLWSSKVFPYPEPVYTGWSSVHWNAIWMPLVDPVYTGIPLGHSANTCRVHWNTTGKAKLKHPALECHWRNSNFCSLHWNTTGGTVAAYTSPDTYS